MGDIRDWLRARVPGWLVRGYWRLARLNYAYGIRSRRVRFRGETVLTYDPLVDHSPDWLLRRMVERCGDGAVIYDVGANRGQYALWLSALVDRATVHAFEPNPRVYPLLRRNVGLNPSADTVRCHMIGVSDEAGTPVLNDAPEPTLGSLHTGHAERLGSGVIDRVPVEVTTIDALVLERGLEPPTAVKVDVEGHERAVLAGAERVIDEFSPTLYVEFHGADTPGEVIPPVGDGYTVERSGRWAVIDPGGR